MLAAQEQWTDEDALDAEELSRRYLVFVLGESRYAVPLQFVREIVEVPTVTPLPDLPSYVRGAVNLRGNVVVVVDVRLRLGIAGASNARRPVMVVVAYEGQRLGFVVDAVRDVTTIDPMDIEGVAYADGSGRAVRGVVQRDTGVEVVLDVPLLFAGEEGSARLTGDVDAES